MRTISLLLATSAIVFTTGTVHVVAHDYRYCIQGDEFSGAGDCSFTTLQQCQATASGRMATAEPILGSRTLPRQIGLVRIIANAKRNLRARRIVVLLLRSADSLSPTKRWPHAILARIDENQRSSKLAVARK